MQIRNELLNRDLIQAVKTGNFEKTESLISQGANINSVEEGMHSLNVLGIALQKQDLPIIEQLIRHGASIFLAIGRAKDLCYHGRIMLEDYCHITKVAMDYAIGHDFPEYTLTYFKFGLGKQVNFCGVSFGGHCATHSYLQKQGIITEEHDPIITLTDIDNLTDEVRKQILQTRLTAAYQTKGKLIRDNIPNFIPLWRAAQKDDEEAIQVRLSAGADPNVRDGEYLKDEKLTPLAWAFRCKKKAAILPLLASPKLDLYDTILAAIQYGEFNVTAIVLKQLNFAERPHKESLLYHCVLHDKPAQLELIVANMSPEKIKDELQAINGGQTLLQMAVQNLKKDCVRVLCQLGADPKQKNHVGETALDILINEKNKIAKLCGPYNLYTKIFNDQLLEQAQCIETFLSPMMVDKIDSPSPLVAARQSWSGNNNNNSEQTIFKMDNNNLKP